jgi:predicted O-linked N-acetylglucosamine transferase (SPINDLY family)
MAKKPSALDTARQHHRAGRLAEAERFYRSALSQNRRLMQAHFYLADVLRRQHRLDEAIASYRAALAIDDDVAQTHTNLGGVLLLAGQPDEAIAEHRAALTRKGASSAEHSNLMFALHFHPQVDARAILDEGRAWNRRHAEPFAADIANHDNDRSLERRLRVGYVSPDFRMHCQAYFTFPLLAHHDHTQLEIHCYSDVLRPDEWTERLLGHADRSVSILGMDDRAVADRIRADRIDILVDLTMHMERNRLGVFAHKPAPIQVCWLAYPGTTGLAAMDYRVTDPFLDPPGSDADVYAEQSLRLPDTFWCYHPLVSEHADNPLPARANGGRITFACLNNFCKVNGAVIELWARVLREVQGSRLMLLVPPGEARRSTLRAFEAHGVEAARLELVDHANRLPYLAQYRRIDVCLDTFPYNGHTTSLDALWMGVPVVTLVGPTVVGRAGLCHAMNLGLPELVAKAPDDYVRIAVELTGDLGRLSQLRAGLRARMERSALMDAPRFARNLEAAYRDIWRRWCDASR